MEPLRVCQYATHFREEQVDGKAMLTPCTVPPCPRCPTKPAAPNSPESKCKRCGMIRMGLYDIESDKLLVPTVSSEMFTQVLGKARATVAMEELVQFEQWTEEFGQEG